MPSSSFNPDSVGRPQTGGQRGFGLLEAIVSLVLLASTGLALFAWVNLNMQTAVRLNEADAAAVLKIAATSLMIGVNPLEQPVGERQLSGLRVRWSAQPDGELTRAGGAVMGGVGRFMVQVFKTTVDAVDIGTQRQVRFELHLVGTRLAQDFVQR